MRYGSMEEAAGQYLAKAVEYADIRVHEGMSIENEKNAATSTKLL